jgi:UDP-N-acetylmuramoyl-L-alanyl-D-glutamate--2,6-diaminopimelate ligase
MTAMTKLLRDLLHELQPVRIAGRTDLPINGLAYDSRRVVAGGLFVAIRGYHVDGHRYIDQALNAGVQALVVDASDWDGQSGLSIADHGALVVVPNSRTALAELAAAFYDYPARQLRTIGITGTKGKSTTTDLCYQTLAGVGLQTGMISTVDFVIGGERSPNTTRQSTPEALEVQSLLQRMFTTGCSHAVLEATSHALAARWNRLGSCDFDQAVFLNLGHEHLDFHGSIAQYRSDKARLFELLGDRRPPSDQRPIWAIANRDDPQHQYFLDAAPAHAHRLTFGNSPRADVRATLLQARPDGSTIRIDSDWGSTELHLRLPGSFNVGNALAALCVALAEEIPLDRAVHALEQAGGPRGRMQPVDCGQPFSVIVDYAHNPESFEQVLSMLRPLVTGRLISVFGSAGERDVAKRAMQGTIAGRYSDLVFLTDEDPRGEDRLAIIDQIAAGVAQSGKRADHDYFCRPDRREAIRQALAAAQPGDLVLLLGKGHEGNIIYADHSLAWNEAAVAAEELRALGYRC